MIGVGLVAVGGSVGIGQAIQWIDLLLKALEGQPRCQGYLGYCLWW